MSEQILANLSELNVDNPIINLLNKFLKANLPDISKATQQVIIKNKLDPMEKVLSNDNIDLGSIDLKFITAKAKASYDVSHLTGLSSLSILKLEIMSVDPNQNDTNAVIGKLQVEAKLDSNIEANIGGSVWAELDSYNQANTGGSLSADSEKINLPKVELSGTVTAANVTANSKFSLNVAICGNKLCLKSVDIYDYSINFGTVNVHINDLGIFDPLLDELVAIARTYFDKEIRNFIALQVVSKLKENANEELKKKPLCVGLPF